MGLLFLFMYVLTKYVLLISMHVIEFHINDIGWDIVDFLKIPLT